MRSKKVVYTSYTPWMDEQAIKQWHCPVHHGRRGRGFHYSDTAIETALMLKRLVQVAAAGARRLH
uniref:Transposase n=1 Tax=Klebsiella pneumoniae TaxID=573 RepID=A0A8B0SYG9_KLEPN|nr:Transposase [Klebsiella pneumoniae]